MPARQPSNTIPNVRPLSSDACSRDRPINRAVSSILLFLSSQGSHSFKYLRLTSINRVSSQASSSEIWRNSRDSFTRKFNRIRAVYTSIHWEHGSLGPDETLART